MYVVLSRHCQRVLPITHICRAFQNDIRKCAIEMLAPHFHIPDTTKQVKVHITDNIAIMHSFSGYVISFALFSYVYYDTCVHVCMVDVRFYVKNNCCMAN